MACNETVKDIEYKSNPLTISPLVVNFGNQTLSSKIESEFLLENKNDASIKIVELIYNRKNIQLKENILNYELKPNEKKKVNFSFSSLLSGNVKDSIVFKMDNGTTYQFYLEANLSFSFSNFHRDTIDLGFVPKNYEISFQRELNLHQNVSVLDSVSKPIHYNLNKEPGIDPTIGKLIVDLKTTVTDNELDSITLYYGDHVHTILLRTDRVFDSADSKLKLSSNFGDSYTNQSNSGYLIIENSYNFPIQISSISVDDNGFTPKFSSPMQLKANSKDSVEVQYSPLLEKEFTPNFSVTTDFNSIQNLSLSINSEAKIFRYIAQYDSPEFRIAANQSGVTYKLKRKNGTLEQGTITENNGFDSDGKTSNYTEFPNADALSLIAQGDTLIVDAPDKISYLRGFVYDEANPIPENIFKHCVNLESVANAFEKNEIKQIPDNLFMRNTKLKYLYGCFRETNIATIPPSLFEKNTEVITFKKAFYKCSLLELIPESLFKNSVQVTNFSQTFQSCKVLKNLPNNLFEANNKVQDFSYTFFECEELESIASNFFANNTEVTDFTCTFMTCSKLKSVGDGNFENKTKVTSFQEIFSECSLLETLPTAMFEGCTNVTSFEAAFSLCSRLTSIPDYLFKNCNKATNFNFVFAYLDNLTTIGTGVFEGATEITSFQSAFHGCSKLLSLPSDLLHSSTKITNFESSFQDCIAIQTIDKDFFKGNVSVSVLSSTFNGCSSLTNIPENLFSTNSALTELNSTFRDCIGLISIPENLFAQNIQLQSLTNTFSGCAGLTSIPAKLFAQNINLSGLTTTFRDCSGLNTLPSQLFKNNLKLINLVGVFTGSNLVSVPADFYPSSYLVELGLVKNSSVLDSGGQPTPVIFTSRTFDDSADNQPVIQYNGAGDFNNAPDVFSKVSYYHSNYNVGNSYNNYVLLQDGVTQQQWDGSAWVNVVIP